MSERICVCGHGEHIGRCKVRIPSGRPKPDLCSCDSFRPCIPWPDAEGYWAADHYCFSEKWQPVFAAWSDDHSELCVFTLGTDRPLHKCDANPARFTKLTFVDPFPTTPPEGTAA